MERASPSTLVKVTLVALLCVIWGTTWLAIKIGLRDLPPLGSASVRMLVAGLVMLVVAPRLARAEGGTKPAWWLWGTVGTLHLGLSFAIVYWCGTRIPSGLEAVLWSVYPLLTAGVGHLLLPGERLTGRQGLGFVVAFAGVALLFWTDLRGIGAEAVAAGAILLVSPLAAAAATLVVKRFGRATSSALLNRNAMLLAAGVHGLLSWLGGEAWPATISARAVGSVAYLALFGTVVTFGVWFWLMRWVPAYKLTLIAYITPAIALLAGAALDGEAVGASTILGTAVILLGVLCASRRR